MIRRTLLTCMLLLFAAAAWSQRWEIRPGGRDIVWKVGSDIPHDDHIEMSGERMAFVLRWGIDPNGAFRQERSLVFPLLRTVPNDTHASLMYRMATDIPSLLGVNGLALQAERVEQVSVDGALTVRSLWGVGKMNVGSARDTKPVPVVEMTRAIFPSRSLPLMCEHYVLRNVGRKPLAVYIPEFSQVVTTDPAKGVAGSYVVRGDLAGSGTFMLVPADSLAFDAVFQAYRSGEEPLRPDVAAEYAARMEFVHGCIDANLVLETPDPVIDTEFRYAKLRAAESIIETRGGYMHAPGGESYYAAVWANDQAEYVNPFFPFLGYGTGNESALNSFRHFARFMNPGYEPLPSSIIAEGDDIWNGAGDRGDAAMIACGAARYALARGSRAEAEELWPLIEWCLEYCRRKLTADGVVASDTDELEGRFPTGEANLCTSTLYYDALLSAVPLGRELGVRPAVTARYAAEAGALAKAIDAHFGGEVGGYDTYRYYDGNTLLRSWICMPLIVGLRERCEGTVRALLSPELLTDDGLLTEQGGATFWDRSTLYALRGIYNAGYADRATEMLHRYSQRRLLGDHVPYPIEAWPEGSQRHLSAESGLYCRIVTEGLFGIRPAGLRSFDLTPGMPSAWERMSLRRIRAFDADFDISVGREVGGKLRITVMQAGKKPKIYRAAPGATIRVKLTD
ncbi:hypothetical protein [Alistipes senegalensis]|uniref:Uncharacterized protein n=1 Tax=Alistipes senegalensis JC50 TaxID=1033732 RepID=A0ABY5VCQ7_9BACT|nr:hypothetical protein [Alistipes senegalensis]UEA85720.1 hypothetical protein LK406_08325 [Alistipes senegalensis]UWN66697.1 hypothetical protein NQ519_07625 [Alistipes senegalensis JC50]